MPSALLPVRLTTLPSAAVPVLRALFSRPAAVKSSQPPSTGRVGARQEHSVRNGKTQVLE